MANIPHSKVLITGGSGFLGRGILRRIRNQNPPMDVTVYSRDEQNQAVCRRLYPGARYVLGDIRDVDRLTSISYGHDVIINAAAIKFIPEAELNVAECIAVNVDGSRAVVDAAIRAGVGSVVGISTDKAVQPINVYGATKMLMERLFSESSTPDTQFNCVRYGNVIGSTGSVIPVFQQQLADKGRVFLTDGTMTRFWMTIDQAIDMVMFALSPDTQPGSIIIPMPKAMLMGDLAMAIAGDAFEEIGARPGEKHHESLLHHQESTRTVEHANYYELMPVMSEYNNGRAPFELPSHHPESWMSKEDMMEAIEDSANV